MGNIRLYFYALTDLIFGLNNNFFSLMTPQNCYSSLHSFSESSESLEKFIILLLGSPSLIFSLIVWSLFAWFIINLLLIYPFKWFRSVIRKCRG